ncbi:hypothetical protein KCV87_07305 [Actinosynnema pretiosum subsp. pretiosum]|uniref:Uncharacterized protein n=1 Tax=Actinosynnema pretiosum subsp. pretiosum TaxID=103721 RepID=A0AA45L925_9PSEU|nr:hypothetical protein APASM_2567 [Actinosynnema pretiosum subsp. pretiosum]QUF05874.1 hypothetical protein KCV87_07305 [Actinosynnema pretiosum subsp. pretiosum]
MSSTPRVPLTTAPLVLRAVALAALVAALWHGSAIPETPERAVYPVLTALDVLVAALCAWLGARWSSTARFETDALVIGRHRVPYAAITGVRCGPCSAKPFWLALLLPVSVIGGLLVLARSAQAMGRQVVEIRTADGRRHRSRWKDAERHGEFTDLLRRARPDLEHDYGVDTALPARDHTPRLGVPGGLVGAFLVAWVLVVLHLGAQLDDLDRLQSRTHDPERAVTALQRVVAFAEPAGLELPHVVEQERCGRVNSVFLGPTPHWVRVSATAEDRSMADADAEGVRTALRAAAGLEPDVGYSRDPDGESGVTYNLNGGHGLTLTVSTGCVPADSAPRVTAALEDVVRALGRG